MPVGCGIRVEASIRASRLMSQPDSSDHQTWPSLLAAQHGQSREKAASCASALIAIDGGKQAAVAVLDQHPRLLSGP